MLNEMNIQHLTEDTDISLNNYHDCLDSIVCPESSSSCFLGECEICQGTAKLKENLGNAFDEHRIDVDFNLRAKRYSWGVGGWNHGSIDRSGNSRGRGCSLILHFPKKLDNFRC